MMWGNLKVAVVLGLMVFLLGCGCDRISGTKPAAEGISEGVPHRDIPTGLVRQRAARVATQSDEVIQAEVRRAAPIISDVLRQVGDALRPGMTTREVHDSVVAGLRHAGLEPAMTGYNGYPAGASVSINEQILHGIPSERRLRSGDLVTIETSGVTERAFASQGWTFPVGETNEQRQRLLATAKRALQRAIQAVRHGARVGDIGAAIQGEVEGAGFAVVRDYAGYGMGQERIQPPQLPCYGRAGTGRRLHAGQILHLHVIAKAGGWQVSVGDDEWTATSADGNPGVLVTAMVLVAKSGPVVLSRLIQ